MTEELMRSIKVIHGLERSIRVLELARDRTRQLVDELTACHENHKASTEINPAVARARAYIAVCDRAIFRAKARIDELEKGE